MDTPSFSPVPSESSRRPESIHLPVRSPSLTFPSPSALLATTSDEPADMLDHSPHEEEQEPLLDAPAIPRPPRSSSRSGKGRWRKAAPVWIAPVVLVSSLCRGMTMAPRIEVYTQLACRAIHTNISSASLPLRGPSQEHYSHLLNSPSPSGVPSITPHSALSSSAADVFLSRQANRDTTVRLPDLPVDVLDQCSGDPKVQARAARIQASVKTTESVLSAITTGWLSHLGDVYGRKKILSISIFGALFMDFIYILVSSTNSVFSKHGEAFIIAAPLIEGVLGAQSTYNGITHAYATDCSPDGSRARIFSTMQGMLYVGLASGPWLNGAVLNLVSWSDTSTLFGLAILIALLNLLFVLVVLPESLPPERRLRPQSTTLHTRTVSGRYVVTQKGFARRVSDGFKSVWVGLVRPVALFAPVRLEGGRKGRDWNLTLVGGALFIYVLSIQVYNLKFLYVKHVYDWSSERLGYYMSLLWVTRAINLLLILPAVLTYFAPRIAPTAPTSVKLANALSFDRRVVAICFFTDATANALVTLSPTSSQALFVFFTSLNSLTSGGNPALHSLGAVSLQAMGKGGEVGLVFGALGLVNAVAHIVAPAIYAAIYGATVAVFPKAMFVMSAVLLYTAVCMLLGIRPFIHVVADTETADPEPQSDVESDETEGRGKRGRGLERDDAHEQVRRASIMRVSISEEGS